MYTLYDNTAVGSIQEAWRREDIDDLVVNLFPLDTPLHQTLESVPVSHYKQQPIDTFSSTQIPRTSAVFATSGAAWSSVLARPEGYTYTDEAENYGGKLISCVVEIQGKQFSVSDSDRNEPMYGITDRFAYEALKKAQSVVNNQEHSMWWSVGSAPAGKQMHTGGGVDVARQTQGLVHWICVSGLQRSKIGLGAASLTDGHGNEFGTNGGTSLNQGASTWAYDANGSALDSSMFKDNLMNHWFTITGRQAGAVGFCGARIKSMFSTFALTANGPINERTLSAASRMIIDPVDYYETEFGVVAINLCRYLNISGQSVAIAQSSGSVTVPYDEVLAFIKPEFFKIGVKRANHMSILGKVGDFESGLIRGEKGLLCKNPQAGVAIVNCVP